ncbi:MAG: putative MPP superfamily phosphohydrolase [Myxococcota bacterium]|jgi:predicted MPP superfamily phosphohydrolase
MERATLAKPLPLAAAMLAAVGMALVWWAFVWEPDALVVVQQELRLPGWRGPSLRVAVLTDLHVGAPHIDAAKVQALVDATNGQQPELILIAGDFVIDGVQGGTFIPPEDFAPILGQLRAPLGVFAVLGNHDWWFDGDRVTRALEDVAIVVLEDEAVKIQHQAGGFWLAGLGDWMTRPHDVDKTVAAITDDAPALLFTHSPDAFPSIPRRFALTIAGHTHGGQVNLPVLGRLVVPSEYGARYAAGHIEEQGKHLYVSTGVGTSILPVRFRVPPEVAILELRTDADR